MEYYKNNHEPKGPYRDITEASGAYMKWMKKSLDLSYNSKVNFGFFPIFNGFYKVASERNLTASEIKVYFLIAEKANKAGITDISNSSIEEHLAMKKRTVEISIKGLESKGMIFRKLAHDQNNRLVRSICLLPY